jgi:hypothetical protein
MDGIRLCVCRRMAFREKVYVKEVGGIVMLIPG